MLSLLSRLTDRTAETSIAIAQVARAALVSSFPNSSDLSLSYSKTDPKEISNFRSPCKELGGCHPYPCTRENTE